MGGTFAFGLFDQQNIRVKGKCRFPHLRGPVASDYNDLSRLDTASCPKRMVQQRRSPNLMQHFGNVRVHPRSLARGKHNERKIGSVRHSFTFL